MIHEKLLTTNSQNVTVCVYANERTAPCKSPYYKAPRPMLRRFRTISACGIHISWNFSRTLETFFLRSPRPSPIQGNQPYLIPAYQPWCARCSLSYFSGFSFYFQKRSLSNACFLAATSDSEIALTEKSIHTSTT